MDTFSFFFRYYYYEAGKAKVKTTAEKGKEYGNLNAHFTKMN